MYLGIIKLQAPVTSHLDICVIKLASKIMPFNLSYQSRMLLFYRKINLLSEGSLGGQIIPKRGLF